jgi:hypothetical protein
MRGRTYSSLRFTPGYMAAFWVLRGEDHRADEARCPKAKLVSVVKSEPLRERLLVFRASLE